MRATTPALLLSMLPLACGGGATSEAEAPRHLLLVSIDTLRADRLGCYGFPLDTSPRIDALAAEGVVFEQAISAASTTLASHTSLMTGTWPHTHGVARNGYRVPDENVLLAERLAAAGFRTGAVIGAAPLDTAVNFGQGFEFYGARYTLERTGQDYPQPLERRAREVTEAALGWLDREALGGDERVFLFVHYFDCHAPYDAPGAFRGRFRETPPELEDPDAELTRVRRELRACLDEGRAVDAELRAAAEGLEADYSAELAYVDRQVGRLLDGLDERGLLADTLVVLTADHGETLTDHDRSFTHGYTVYDSEVRVPLIVRGPGVRAGREPTVVSGVDVAPTVLEVLGVPTEGPRPEGRSLAPALWGEPLEPRPVFAEATKPTGRTFKDDPVWANRARFQAVRTERWKYARRDPDAREELYDLGADPGERRDLLAGPDAGAVEPPPEARAVLSAALEEWRASTPGARAAALESDDHTEALRALGYVDDD